jgi:hypothetical protein
MTEANREIRERIQVRNQEVRSTILPWEIGWTYDKQALV